MTDGIIQEVFKSLIDSIEKTEHKDKWIIIRNCYKSEQELIEKIKQEFELTPFIHVYGAHKILQKLIGDNQE